MNNLPAPRAVALALLSELAQSSRLLVAPRWRLGRLVEHKTGNSGWHLTEYHGIEQIPTTLSSLENGCDVRHVQEMVAKNRCALLG
jgi:hypothetical protein